MSQPYYSDYSQQQYYSDSYDSANTMHSSNRPPNDHIQSHTSDYEYQNQYYDTAPGDQPVDNSSTLAQTYSYSDVNCDNNNTMCSYTSYGSVPNYSAVHLPDPVSHIPHQGVPQYGDATPGQAWTGPAQYVEVTTVRPGDLHDRPRGSCSSTAGDNDWDSDGRANSEHYDYLQPAIVDQGHHPDDRYQQSQQLEEENPTYFGMYSPTRHLRIQELVRSSPCDATNQVPKGNSEAPYGALPVHGVHTQQEGLHSESIGHSNLHQTSRVIQQYLLFAHGQPQQQPASPATNSSESGTGDIDLYFQQRLAAGYQHRLQVDWQNELKNLQPGRLDQGDMTNWHHEKISIGQGDACVPMHDIPHHENYRIPYQCQTSSSSDCRLPSAPIVPSQARERPTTCAQRSPEAKEKKDILPKKPALACWFCRRRKIACGPPPPDNTDGDCNQCVRRKQSCEYPTESRRGMRRAQKEPVPGEPTTSHLVNVDRNQRQLTGAIRIGRVSRKCH